MPQRDHRTAGSKGTSEPVFRRPSVEFVRETLDLVTLEPAQVAWDGLSMSTRWTGSRSSWTATESLEPAGMSRPRTVQRSSVSAREATNSSSSLAGTLSRIAFDTSTLRTIRRYRSVNPVDHRIHPGAEGGSIADHLWGDSKIGGNWADSSRQRDLGYRLVLPPVRKPGHSISIERRTSRRWPE
jgi:hypothetical protein